MRDFFYWICIPPDSNLGFIVVERRGRNTPTNAIQQTLRQRFHKSDLSALFRLVTDENEFDEWLSGRVAAVKAEFVPQTKESRKVVKDSMVFGTGLSVKNREDVDIKFTVNRRITPPVKSEIKKWLQSEPGNRPKIVTLPVSEEPDRIILCIQTDDGRQKQLHPDMIADMALTVDLTTEVHRSANGQLNFKSAAQAAEKLAETHRSALTKRG